MKKMKKILAVVLAMAMVLGMSLTSMAATAGDTETNKFGSEGDRGSITIKGVLPEYEKAKEGDTKDDDGYKLVDGKRVDQIDIELYPVMQAQYDTQTKLFKEYSNPYGVEKDSNGAYTLSQAKLDEIGAKAQSEVTPLSGITWETVEEGGSVVGYKTAKVDGKDVVPVGMYLVVVKGAETKIYNYAVASIYYEEEDGDNSINEDPLVMIKDGETSVKVTNHPEVDKKASQDANHTTLLTTANIGDTVYYTVEIDPVPYYGGKNPVLNVVDTLSAGLTLNKDSIKVVVEGAGEEGADKELTKGTDYFVPAGSLTDKGLMIDFVKVTEDDPDTADVDESNKEYTLNGYAGEKVIISYSAVLNENAALNQAGNSNEVVLSYTKDSKVSSEQDPTVDEEDKDKTYTYTFDIDGIVKGSETAGIITKYGEEKDDNGKEKPLDGAIFTLYTSNPDNLSGEDLTKAIYKNYKFVDDPENPGQLKKVTVFDGTEIESKTVTDSDNKKHEGQLQMHGLAAGTYYLKETKAPAGYSLNTDVFKIVITPINYDSEGRLTSWKITIDGKDIANFTVNHDADGNATLGEGSGVGKDGGTKIPNTKMSGLPSTGGIGTTIFTIGGCAIMIIAAGLFFASRRKSSK